MISDIYIYMDDIWDAVNDYGDRMDIGPIGSYHQEITNATKRNAGLMDFFEDIITWYP